MKKLLPLLLIFSLVACQSKGKKSTTENTPKLVLEWETDTLMTTCESALYDKASGLIYISNIHEGPWDFDHNGFISTINTKGEINEQYWLTEELSAPKGMGLYQGKLYVNDINRLVEIDVNSKKIEASYYLEGEPALNDVAISKDGRVFSSSSATSDIYELVDGELVELGKTPDGRLNGLYVDGDKIYFTQSSLRSFGYFDIKERNYHILTEEIGWGDGIVKLKNGDFITSSWEGELYHISSKTWKKTLLLDTREEGINAADIDYIPELDLLIVPTFFNNTVRAYKVS